MGGVGCGNPLFGFLGKWGSRVALERVFMSPDTSPEAAFCIEKVMKATEVVVNTYGLHGLHGYGGKATILDVLREQLNGRPGGQGHPNPNPNPNLNGRPGGHGQLDEGSVRSVHTVSPVSPVSPVSLAPSASSASSALSAGVHEMKGEGKGGGEYRDDKIIADIVGLGLSETVARAALKRTSSRDAAVSWALDHIEQAEKAEMAEKVGAPPLSLASLSLSPSTSNRTSPPPPSTEAVQAGGAGGAGNVLRSPVAPASFAGSFVESLQIVLQWME